MNFSKVSKVKNFCKRIVPMKKHKMGEDFVRRWHAESGTKWDVICHSIIVILLTIMLAIIVACFFITWINYEFNAGLLIFIPLFFFHLYFILYL